MFFFSPFVFAATGLFLFEQQLFSRHGARCRSETSFFEKAGGLKNPTRRDGFANFIPPNIRMSGVSHGFCLWRSLWLIGTMGGGSVSFLVVQPQLLFF